MATFFVSLTVVLRVTSLHGADVTTVRYLGNESSDVIVTSEAHEQYVNPRPGKRVRNNRDVKIFCAFS